MSKRKRGDIEEVSVAQNGDQTDRIKVSRLEASIIRGIDSLTSALKLAKGFERQKMGRRQKQAVKDPQKLLRLREEVIILRELDLRRTARNYLLKQMVRTKRISGSATFRLLYGHGPKIEAPKNAAEANVTALLFKSSPVSQLLPTVMQGIHDVLGLPRVSGPSRTDPALAQASLTNHDSVLLQPSRFQGPLQRSLTASELLSESAQDSLNHNSGASDIDEASQSRKLPIEPYDASISLSGSDTDESVNDDHDSDVSDVEMKQSKTLSKTAFLPSLSMGGYYSGSESDRSDFNDERTDGLLSAQPRKNRRGQRERQKIAEKKFGRNAKHLQHRKQQPSRDDGWDLRRGAVQNTEKATRQSYREEKNDRGTDARKAKSTSAKSRSKQSEPIHPSWEAARKRKEEHNNQLKAFAGKKIDFD